MFARQLSSSTPLSLPFPSNSTGLAQRVWWRETDAHGRSQSRHTAQHGDISARRQTVRIPTLTPLVRNRILSVILLRRVRHKGASDHPRQRRLSATSERVCKKKTKCWRIWGVSKASRRLNQSRWKTLEAEKRAQASWACWRFRISLTAGFFSRLV